MPIVDAFCNSDQTLVEAVAGMEQKLRNRYFESPAITTYRSLGVAREVSLELGGFDTPPAGIFGTGVVDFQDRMRPAIFMLLELCASPVEFLFNPAGSPLTESQTPAHQLVLHFLSQVPKETVVVGLPRIRNFAAVAPWAKIEVDGNTSTLGVRVNLPDGRRGITTAGHGARVVNQQVCSDGQAIGAVAWTSCREAAPGVEPVSDIALIALDQEVVEHPLSSRGIPPPRPPAPQEIVAVAKRNASASGRVWGVTNSFAVDAHAPWGDVMLCSPMSAPGDSGSLVLSENDGAWLGHVVGGAVGGITVVQELSYQLAAAAATIRP